MDNISPQEKEQILRDFERKQERMYKIGKIIIFSIATINMIMSIISFFLNYNFISLVIQIILSIALYRGVTWVRYFFAVGAAFGTILTFRILLVGDFITNAPIPVIIFYILNLIYEVSSTIVLFANKNVSEFLYSQKFG